MSASGGRCLKAEAWTSNSGLYVLHAVIGGKLSLRTGWFGRWPAVVMTWSACCRSGRFTGDGKGSKQLAIGNWQSASGSAKAGSGLLGGATAARIDEATLEKPMPYVFGESNLGCGSDCSCPCNSGARLAQAYEPETI